MFTEKYYNLTCAEIYKSKLVDTIGKILELEKEIEPIEIFLFGSVARGTYNAKSDLDLCIVSQKDSHKISVLLEYHEIRDDIGYPNVDIIVRRPNDLTDETFAINRFMQRDKVILWSKEG